MNFNKSRNIPKKTRKVSYEHTRNIYRISGLFFAGAIKEWWPAFFQQWNFLIAVAKEDVVRKITAQGFIARYDIGTPANSRRLLKALLEKELLLEVQETHAVSYQVYDDFFHDGY